MKTYIYSDLSFDREEPFAREPTALEKAFVHHRKRKKKKQICSLIAILLIFVSVTLLVCFFPRQAKYAVFKLTSFDLVERSKSVAIETNTSLQKELKNWNELTNEEKEQTAEEVMEAELLNLQIPYKVKFKLSDIGFSFVGVATGGHKIEIDREYLYSCTALSIVDTMAHEVKHIHQFAIMDMRRTSHPLFVDYKLPDDATHLAWSRIYNFHFGKLVYEHPLEKDAIKYAAVRTEYYQHLLDL